MAGRATPLLVALAVIVVTLAGCGSGAQGATASRPRPTDTAGLHDHGAADSALAPETVRPEDLALLGDGVEAGGRIEGYLGLNLCGRFLEIPEGASAAGVTLEQSGHFVVEPGEGDEVGLEVTVGDLLQLLEVGMRTGELEFGSQWSASPATVGGEEFDLGGSALATGDSCGDELGEVQLWYYTEEAANSGDGIRIVVTDPQDAPIIGDGVALTVAFAPSSSLPTLPPAVMAG